MVPAGPAGAVAVGGSETANTHRLIEIIKSTSKDFCFFFTKCIVLKVVEFIFLKFHKQFRDTTHRKGIMPRGSEKCSFVFCQQKQ